MFPERVRPPSRTEKLAEYHFLAGMYVKWVNTIFPDGPPDGWRPPVPLMAQPGGPPDYLRTLARRMMLRDVLNRLWNLPALVVVRDAADMADILKDPARENALVILFTDSSGTVLEAWSGGGSSESACDGGVLIWPAETHPDIADAIRR